MKKKTLVRVAGQSIVKNKMRTLLTMLGIVIGVGAVIVMVAVGHGARSTIEQQIGALGTNLIMVTAGSGQQGGVSQGAQTFNRLTVDDAEKLSRDATLVVGVSPVINSRGQVISGEGNWRTAIQGVSTAYPAIRGWETTSGAFFTDADVNAKRKVVLLGATVAENLFPGQDPVGQQVQVRSVPMTIVGVMARKGQTANGNDMDDVVLLPYTTMQARLAGGMFIGQIIASTSSAGEIPAAQEEIRLLMRESHRQSDGEPDDFTIRNQNELAQAATGTTQVLSALLAAIASVSLLVGGIGIMNIMLVSVTERTREIGIRMAIGARGSDVLLQFLVESVVMSLLGGLIGLLAGYGGAALLGHFTGWSTSTPPAAVAMAVGFSAAVGVFFGFYPARKAAAMNPIEALRYE